MSRKLKVGLLVGVFLITAFAFAESGGQLQPMATVTAAVGQPAAAAAMPEAPKAAAATAPAPAPVKKGLGITYGIDGRLRVDMYNNYPDMTNSLNDESGFARLRTRLFMNVPLGQNIDGFIRVANESWKRFNQTLPPCNAAHPTYCSPTGFSKTGGVPLTAQDIWIDNAYLDFKKLPIKNTTLRVGRQDMIRGDGMLSVWTGAGGWGPKGGGMNAFDLGYTRGKHKFELMGMWNPMTDDFFPVINQKYPVIPFVTPSGVDVMNENGTQQAIGVYYTNRQFKTTDLDAYYFFAKEYDMAYLTAPSSYQFLPDRHFNQLSGRIVHRFSHDIIAHETFVGEFGTQDAMGVANNPRQFAGLAYPQADIRAWGSFGFITKYFPKVKTKPYVRFVTEMLSGQDPKSKTVGDYDMLFGRYTGHPNPLGEMGYANPMFSDGYVYNTRAEIGNAPAYYTNLKLFGAEAGFTPFEGKVRRLQIVAAYQHAGAFQPFAPDPVHQLYAAQMATIPDFFSTTGKTRYQMVKADLRFVLYKQLGGYMTFEKLFYGDFYNSSFATPLAPGGIAYRNNGIFWRTELNYNFSGFLPFHKLPKI